MAHQPLERENNLGQSIILFIVFFVLFCGGIFSFSFLTLENVWPAALALVLIFLSLVIPMTWIGRSNSVGGK
ncbi:MAG: hypothetical protein HIU81_10735 [Acidobacteria bacterium]|nr:hypothetical protein [Acidobacteriota bacterium]